MYLCISFWFKEGHCQENEIVEEEASSLRGWVPAALASFAAETAETLARF